MCTYIHTYIYNICLYILFFFLGLQCILCWSHRLKAKIKTRSKCSVGPFIHAVGCVLLTENRCVGAVPESGSFWGVFDKHSNCHRATVKHTCKRRVLAVCLRQVKISRCVAVKSWICDTLIWHCTIFALRDTVQRTVFMQKNNQSQLIPQPLGN